jgi:hypothetical protein
MFGKSLSRVTPATGAGKDDDVVRVDSGEVTRGTEESLVAPTSLSALRALRPLWPLWPLWLNRVGLGR